MDRVFVRSAYNYDMDEASLEAGIDDGNADGSMPSKAVQSQKDEADINVIVKRFGLTGELPISQRIPLVVDVDEILDYRMCLDRVNAGVRSFNSMPADVRARFNNDPASFLEFFESPDNRQEAVKLGLIESRQDSSGSPPVAPPAVPPA